jgi:Ala-tRNA(Pro) deacylase
MAARGCWDDAGPVPAGTSAPISFTVRLPSVADTRCLALEGADLRRWRLAVLALRDLTERLDALHVRYELLHHPRTTTAASEARALHVPDADVAKTIVLVAPHGCVRAVVPASARLGVKKVQDLLEEYSLEPAGEPDLARLFPEFELGAVPPFGGVRRDLAVLDRSLLARAAVVVEAGTHEESIRLSPEDLVRVCDARVADIRRDD